MHTNRPHCMRLTLLVAAIVCLLAGNLLYDLPGAGHGAQALILLGNLGLLAVLIAATRRIVRAGGAA